MGMSSKRIRNTTIVKPSPKVVVAATVDDALRKLGVFGILLPQFSETRDYLARHPDLIDTVLRAARVAQEKLGGQAQLSLEMYLDPEVEDSYPTLYVRKDEYAEQIFDLIEETRSVYEPGLAGKSGWFLVTTDLGPPR